MPSPRSIFQRVKDRKSDLDKVIDANSRGDKSTNPGRAQPPKVVSRQRKGMSAIRSSSSKKK